MILMKWYGFFLFYSDCGGMENVVVRSRRMKRKKWKLIVGETVRLLLLHLFQRGFDIGNHNVIAQLQFGKAPHAQHKETCFKSHSRKSVGYEGYKQDRVRLSHWVLNRHLEEDPREGHTLYGAFADHCSL